MVGETLRRLECYINKPIDTNERCYATPYEDFTHPHMETLNNIVIDAIGAPAGISVPNLLRQSTCTATTTSPLEVIKDQKVVYTGKTTTLFSLQWPYQLSLARIIDTDNRVWRFDLTTLKEKNIALATPHINLGESSEYLEKIRSVTNLGIRPNGLLQKIAYNRFILLRLGRICQIPYVLNKNNSFDYDRIEIRTYVIVSEKNYGADTKNTF